MKTMANTEETRPKIEIYTEGAGSGNPGAGGYGVVMRFKKASGEVVQKE
jgi:ribonuclease HI